MAINHVVTVTGSDLSRYRAGEAPSPLPAVGRTGFHIGGLTCAADAALVSSTLRQLEGMLSFVLSPVTEVAYATFDPSRTSPDAIRRALDATGYGPATPWHPA